MSGRPGDLRPAPDPLALELPAVSISLVAVRRALAVWLAAAGVAPDVIGALQLAVGEACANAVDHAYPADRPGVVRVRVRADDGARVTATVDDDGTWRAPDRDPGDRGRGLLIMRQLLDEVAVTRGPAGTTVVLRVRSGALPRRAAAAVHEPDTLEIDRSGEVPRVRATGPLGDDAAEGVRLRLLQASRGGVVATEFDITAAPDLGPAAVAAIADVAAIGRADGGTLRVVVPAGGPLHDALTRAGVEVSTPGVSTPPG